MRANLLKCDEGRLNSYMIKSCSKYFVCLTNMGKKENTTCGYKNQIFWDKVALASSLTHVGKKIQCNQLI